MAKKEATRSTAKKAAAKKRRIDPPPFPLGEAELRPQTVAVSFGPEHAPLEQRQVEQAWEEAGTLSPKPDILLLTAFHLDPEAAKDIDEATKWIGGRDRIHRIHGVATWPVQVRRIAAAGSLLVCVRATHSLSAEGADEAMPVVSLVRGPDPSEGT